MNKKQKRVLAIFFICFLVGAMLFFIEEDREEFEQKVQTCSEACLDNENINNCKEHIAKCKENPNWWKE